MLFVPRFCWGVTEEDCWIWEHGTRETRDNGTGSLFLSVTFHRYPLYCYCLYSLTMCVLSLNELCSHFFLPVNSHYRYLAFNEPCTVITNRYMQVKVPIIFFSTSSFKCCRENWTRSWRNWDRRKETCWWRLASWNKNQRSVSLWQQMSIWPCNKPNHTYCRIAI